MLYSVKGWLCNILWLRDKGSKGDGEELVGVIGTDDFEVLMDSRQERVSIKAPNVHIVCMTTRGAENHRFCG